MPLVLDTLKLNPDSKCPLCAGSEPRGWVQFPMDLAELRLWEREERKPGRAFLGRGTADRLGSGGREA